LPVAIAAIRRSDNGFIFRRVTLLRRGYVPSRKHQKHGTCGNGAGAAKHRSDHENSLTICLQHSKAAPGDHDLNRVGDAIVMGGRNASVAASGGIAGDLKLQRVQARQHTGLTKCPIALPLSPGSI
jgi:hypothetical protein